MDNISIILLTTIFIVWALLVWTVICNNRCYDAQMKKLEEVSVEAVRLINEGCETHEWKALYEEYSTISYKDSYWRLFTFRSAYPKNFLTFKKD